MFSNRSQANVKPEAYIKMTQTPSIAYNEMDWVNV